MRIYFFLFISNLNFFQINSDTQQSSHVRPCNCRSNPCGTRTTGWAIGNNLLYLCFQLWILTDVLDSGVWGSGNTSFSTECGAFSFEWWNPLIIQNPHEASVETNSILSITALGVHLFFLKAYETVAFSIGRQRESYLCELCCESLLGQFNFSCHCIFSPSLSLSYVTYLSLEHLVTHTSLKTTFRLNIKSKITDISHFRNGFISWKTATESVTSSFIMTYL